GADGPCDGAREISGGRDRPETAVDHSRRPLPVAQLAGRSDGQPSSLPLYRSGRNRGRPQGSRSSGRLVQAEPADLRQPRAADRLAPGAHPPPHRPGPREAAERVHRRIAEPAAGRSGAVPALIPPRIDGSSIVIFGRRSIDPYFWPIDG